MFKGFFCKPCSAEKEGFEPPDLLQSTVFKTAAFDHSAISPVKLHYFRIASANIVSFFKLQNKIDKKSIVFFNNLYNNLNFRHNDIYSFYNNFSFIELNTFAPI